MRLALALVLACLLASCAEPPPSPSAPLSVLPREAGPLDALNRRHGRLRERLRVRGYGEEVGLARVLVLEDRGAALPLDLATGSCSTFVALGGGAIRQLEMTLYDAEGAETASDSVDGEGALVHVCPQAEEGVDHRPFHLVVSAREGAGAALVAQFRSDPGSGDGFDGLFEGVLAPRVEFRALEEHLARTRGALRSRGFAPVGAPLLERVTEGAVVRLPVELSAGRCYAAVGRADGPRDIDLYLFDAAGVEVDRDLAGDAEPSIEHCPTETARHTVELRAFEGAGAVGIMVMVGPGHPEAEAPDTLEPAGAPADPGLAIEVLSAPLRERGFGVPLFIARDAAIVPGEVRTHEVVVGPGCGIGAGAASSEGIDLDLYLADAYGREIDSDTAVHSTARVRACRAEPTVLRVAVKAYGADGAYALALLRAPEGVDSLQSLRLEEATAPYRLRGYGEETTFEADLQEGERVRHPLPPLAAGECLAVAAAGNDGVADVDLFLLDEAGELVTSDSGPAPHAAISRCAEHAETLTLELSMYRGAGRVAARVLEQRPEPSPAEE